MLHVTSEVENKIAGCLLDTREMLATMDVNDRFKEQRKAAGIRCKNDKIMIYNLLFTYIHRS